MIVEGKKLEPAPATSSPQRSSKTAIEVSSGSASTAEEGAAPADSADQERRESSPEVGYAALNGVTSTDLRSAANAESVLHCSCDPSASADIDHALAHWLEHADEPVDFRVLKQATSGRVCDDVGGHYLCFEAARSEQLELKAVPKQWGFCSLAGRTSEASSLEHMKRLAADGSATPLAQQWRTETLSLPSRAEGDSETGHLVRQALELVGAVLPPERLPPTPSSSELDQDWLACAPAAARERATDLRLEGGGPHWVSGFTKHHAALQPVHFSLPIGPGTQEYLGRHGAQQLHTFRRWVVQQDDGGLETAERMLQKWRADSGSSSKQPAAENGLSSSQQNNKNSCCCCFEEVDSRAVVFGSGSSLGPSTEILQEPGDVVCLQRQGHCSWASGGFFLAWNVALGAAWPGHALREAGVRSKALQAAAVRCQNPRLGLSLNQPVQLHVLKLLFSAACSLPKVHGTIREGLLEHFLPLCRTELERQRVQSLLPQLNAPSGSLGSEDPSRMRCHCCWAELLFSFVHLVKRKGESSGDFCWLCWEARRDIGLEVEGKSIRNARNCTTVDRADLSRLVCILEGRPAKRAKTL